ncbi:hypothetical protein BT96DRAFT_977061 [Gymnopus androsaceus JB14]|uniref:Coatomer subunit delta n=1 Tax=Gymnopus androsaceus JB14 TaxID=1447944 RepID=A0A6A4HHZ0_9AGAR|nr:hypothetical protein BT96DRAFT_977061 [Gymnopus androsaceus JB14]
MEMLDKRLNDIDKGKSWRHVFKGSENVVTSNFQLPFPNSSLQTPNARPSKPPTSAEEREILSKSFEILGAFDEVNKEAEAKEELKRRAKQLETQRREQQRRTTSLGVDGSGYLGGGSDWVFCSPTSSTRAPASKGTGMKLGSKKAKQAELLDTMGGAALETTSVSPNISAPSTPSIAVSRVAAPVSSEKRSVPEVVAESVHIVIKEQLSFSLLRDGGVQSMELKGDMNLLITDADLAHIKISLAQSPADFGNSLHFKQHPNVAKFAPGGGRVVTLKDPSRAFPVGQSLAVLQWSAWFTCVYASHAYCLIVNCWPTPSNDGTCEVSIEDELENESLALHDVVISIPLPHSSHPTVYSHTGDWSLNPSSHSIAWTIPVISVDSDTKSGSLIFNVGGDDAGAFFPVDVSFVGRGSLAGVNVASIAKTAGGDVETFSVDLLLTVDEYLVV